MSWDVRAGRGCTPMLTPEDCAGAAQVAPAPPAVPPFAAPAVPAPAAPAPVYEQVPTDQVLAPPAPAAGVPADPSPIEHVLPPEGWEPPSWDFSMPSVDSVIDTAISAGMGAGVAFAASAGMVQVARSQGWEAREIRNWAFGSMAMPVGAVLIERDWTAPLDLVAEGAAAAQLGGGFILGGVAAMAISAIPLGWTAAMLWWARHREQVEGGLAGSPRKTLRYQRRHQAAKARATRKAAKQAVPLTVGWPVPSAIVLGVASQTSDPTPGSVWSSLIARKKGLMTLPLAAADEHLVMLGNTGSGKTTTYKRVGAALFTADWQKYLHGGPRPLLVMLDCGGDPKTGREFVEMMARLGVQPDRIGLWPDQASLDLWTLGAEQITEILQKTVCPVPPSDSAQEYFFKGRRRVVRLAMGTAAHIGRPVPPPRSRAELFARMASPKALKALYPHDQAILEEIDGFGTTKPPMVASVAGMLRDVWDSLGPALDSGKSFDDFDAIYLRVPGTTMKDTARAQAATVLEMLIKYAATGDHGRRIRLGLDELSAVNDAQGDIGVVEILERARKYGLSCLLNAQSFEGLAPTAETARRIMVGASGGAILMRNEGADEASKIFGTAPKSEGTRHTLGGRHGDEGSTGISESYLVNPDRLREMRKGEAVYVHSRAAVWGSIVPITLDDITPIEQTAATKRTPVEPKVRLKPVTKKTFVDTDVDDNPEEPNLGEIA
ncbi:hypothetical protein [Nocardia cyriacigeorgica]|uniref:hypothetical protein n=1 Tax=Nocardia cyriacigeorgica TaxID=135487 RepID=UPI0034DB1656